jgi:hypothetical protein
MIDTNVLIPNIAPTPTAGLSIELLQGFVSVMVYCSNIRWAILVKGGIIDACLSQNKN